MCRIRLRSPVVRYEADRVYWLLTFGLDLRFRVTSLLSGGAVWPKPPNNGRSSDASTPLRSNSNTSNGSNNKVSRNLRSATEGPSSSRRLKKPWRSLLGWTNCLRGFPELIVRKQPGQHW